MAQTAVYTVVDAESVDGTYETLTNQGCVSARTVYVQGPFTGTVKLEASPARTGNEWYEVFSSTSAGAQDLDVVPVVCHRLRAKLASMSAGPVTVKIACLIEP